MKILTSGLIGDMVVSINDKRIDVIYTAIPVFFSGSRRVNGYEIEIHNAYLLHNGKRRKLPKRIVDNRSISITEIIASRL